MDGPGKELTSEIRQDLRCPQCQYNLRGLSGRAVSCPECGTRWDVVKLAKLGTRWGHSPPGMSDLFWPSAVAVPAALVMSPVALLDLTASATYLALSIMVFLPLWVWLMWRAWRAFGEVEGIYLALLYHAVVAGYLIAGFGFFLSAVGLVIRVRDLPLSYVLGAVCMLVLFCAIGYVCWRGEHFIATRCIQRHLAKVPLIQTGATRQLPE